MIDLIRESAVPASVMRSAARGALSLPTGEMMEILVYLTGNPIFAEQAKMTLAGWDEASSIETACNPKTPWEVLAYMIAPQNLRPKLLPALLNNPSIREAVLVDMAQQASREVVEHMLGSQRVMRSAHILHALLTNAHLKPAEADKLREVLRSIGEEESKIVAYHDADRDRKTQFEIEHADEIAAAEAENLPFQLCGQEEELEDLDQLEPVVPAGADSAEDGGAQPPEFRVAAESTAEGTSSAATVAVAASPAASSGSGTGAGAGGDNAPFETEAVRLQKIRDAAAQGRTRERLTTFQKIARMGVRDRIILAGKGTKEERFILIRDGARLVTSAVLHSPKLTEAEVEYFATMKNVSDNVLREISRNHKFMKNYNVIRNLTNNPRTPVDLSLTLVNHLMVGDLKSLSGNKNVADTLRKVAVKRFKDRTETKRGGSGGD
jgi:hypothetical protein